MSWISRAIAVGSLRHVTQRGNYRQTVFAEEEDEEKTAVIKATLTGRPCGGEDLVKGVEERLGRVLIAQPRGRPRKSGK